MKLYELYDLLADYDPECETEAVCSKEYDGADFSEFKENFEVTLTKDGVIRIGSIS